MTVNGRGIQTSAGPSGATWARLLAGVVSLAVMSVLVITGSRAAFTDSTENRGNYWNTGGIELTDDAPADSVMYEIDDMKPGQSDIRCIAVTYLGDYDADVKLYSEVSSEGQSLAAYLDIEVEVGEGGAWGDDSNGCDGFTADDGPPLVDSTLAWFGTAHSEWSNGALAFTPEPSEEPTTKTFRFTVSLVDDDNEAQNRDATAEFTWEVQTK
jgi:hypothetical protein